MDPDRAEPVTAARGRVAAVVLAAGASSRMGGVNKLLLAVDGEPMVRRVVAAAVASRADPVVVVLGHQADAVAAVVAGLGAELVRNPRPGAGMAGSIRAGVAALPGDCGGVLMCLGDMPWVEARHLDRLIAAFAAAGGHGPWVPTWQGRRGNPVLLGRRYFPALLALEGDRGARDLIASRPPGLQEVPMEDDAVHRDVDVPADLARDGSG